MVKKGRHLLVSVLFFLSHQAFRPKLILFIRKRKLEKHKKVRLYFGVLYLT